MFYVKNGIFFCDSKYHFESNHQIRILRVLSRNLLFRQVLIILRVKTVILIMEEG